MSTQELAALIRQKRELQNQPDTPKNRIQIALIKLLLTEGFGERGIPYVS